MASAAFFGGGGGGGFGGGMAQPAQPSPQEIEQMQMVMATMVEKKFEAEMFSR